MVSNIHPNEDPIASLLQTASEIDEMGNQSSGQDLTSISGVRDVFNLSDVSTHIQAHHSNVKVEGERIGIVSDDVRNSGADPKVLNGLVGTVKQSTQQVAHRNSNGSRSNLNLQDGDQVKVSTLSRTSSSGKPEAVAKNNPLLEKRDQLVAKYQQDLKQHGFMPDGSRCKIYDRVQATIDELAKSENPAVIEKCDKALHMTIETLKIDPLKDKMYITSGKVKDVFDAGTHVVYTPVESSIFQKIYKGNEAELKEEAGQKTVDMQVDIILKVVPKIDAKTAHLLIKEFGTLDNILVLLQNSFSPELADIKASLEKKYPKNSPVPTDLIQELMKLKDAQKELKNLVSNIALNAEILKSGSGIGSKLTVKVEKAVTDLDLAISEGIKDENGVKQPLTEEQTVSFGEGMLNGYASLHRIDMSHGDSKLENILVYESGCKIADLGKAKRCDSKTELFNKGNLRFSAPENKVSHKAETYSAAMILIRLFEEPILREKMARDPNDNMILTNSSIDSSVQVLKNRHGVEKFVVQNKNMPQTESFLGRMSYMQDMVAVTITGSHNLNAEKEINHYIDALVMEKNVACVEKSSKTPEEKSIEVARNVQFGELLKSMMKANPQERITTQKALEEYRKIFGIQVEV
jgi:hypothetical protein